MTQLYHLALDRETARGAKIALLPGDPGRVEKLALALDSGAREVASKREYRTFLAEPYDGHPALVTSTGIGGPSASIAVDELAQIGVKTFLRVGSTGAIQDHVQVGDVVITSGSVRLDGASTHYAPIEYPAVAHHELVQALLRAAEDEGIRHHVGVTASTDTFFPGQERSDSYSGHVLRRLQGQTEELRRLHVLNYEMESSTILTLCAALGLKGGCVTGVVGHRDAGEAIDPEALAAGEENAIRVAVGATRYLLPTE